MLRPRMRHALPCIALLLLFVADVDAQRGRSSSSRSSSGRSSISSGRSSSVRSASPSRSSRSSSSSFRSGRSSSSRSVGTVRSSGSSSSSWRSGSSSSSRGSYVAPSTSRGSTRYLSPSSSSRSTGSSYSPSSRSSRPGSTYQPITDSSSRSNSEIYGARGSSDLGSSRSDPLGTSTTDSLGSRGSDSTIAPTGSDIYTAPSRRGPSFPRAYRPTTYTPETYQPRTYAPRSYTQGRGTTPTTPVPTSNRPTDVSDIARRYSGGERGSRSNGASDGTLSDIARRGGASSLRPPAEPDGTSVYGRGPLRRLTPRRTGDAPAGPDGLVDGSGSTAGTAAAGGQRGIAPTTPSGRRTGGATVAGSGTSQGARVAGNVVAPGGTAGGTAGYVTPVGGVTTTATVIANNNWSYYKNNFPFCYPSNFYFGWYAWCWPAFTWHWYYPWWNRNQGTVVAIPYDSAPNTTVIVQREFVGEGAVYYDDPTAVAPAQESTPLERAGLTTAAERYLNLGDRAFREGRFGDAVHFYAKAVEFSPDEGVLYLVLADALFATGDYHYAAFAVRKALDLDPTLVDAVVDKHGFYGNATDFDKQIGVAESYVTDHPLDTDARLVLGVNYLFGGRAKDAVRLLEHRYADSLRSDAAAQLVLESARRLR